MEIKQGLQQLLSPRMELCQDLTLVQQLQLYLPEHSPFFSLEKDEDGDLLYASAPFLFLHECSHVLYRKGKVLVPLPAHADHDALETGIDRSAILLGPRIGRYTPEQMYLSHSAMAKRVFRDFLEIKKFKVQLPLLARLYCQVQEHRQQTKNEVLGQQLEHLIQQADAVFSRQKEFQGKVAGYAEIYRNTTLR